MNSKDMRNDTLFMRNQFEGVGQWGLPLIKKQDLSFSEVKALAYSQTRKKEAIEAQSYGVHFFVDDYRFNNIYENPERSIEKLSQYSFLFSPDFSVYADMPRWKQLENVAKNRWCGAYWQSKGKVVIPTISWGGAASFSFCFDGIESHATVAIGMIGCKHSHLGFMRGYTQLLERKEPEKILIVGTPFPEMEGNIIPVRYPRTRREM